MRPHVHVRKLTQSPPVPSLQLCWKAENAMRAFPQKRQINWCIGLMRIEYICFQLLSFFKDTYSLKLSLGLWLLRRGEETLLPYKIKQIISCLTVAWPQNYHLHVGQLLSAIFCQNDHIRSKKNHNRPWRVKHSAWLVNKAIKPVTFSNTYSRPQDLIELV